MGEVGDWSYGCGKGYVGPLPGPGAPGRPGPAVGAPLGSTVTEVAVNTPLVLVPFARTMLPSVIAWKDEGPPGPEYVVAPVTTIVRDWPKAATVRDDVPLAVTMPLTTEVPGMAEGVTPNGVRPWAFGIGPGRFDHPAPEEPVLAGSFGPPKCEAMSVAGATKTLLASMVLPADVEAGPNAATVVPTQTSAKLGDVVLGSAKVELETTLTVTVWSPMNVVSVNVPAAPAVPHVPAVLLPPTEVTLPPAASGCGWGCGGVGTTKTLLASIVVLPGDEAGPNAATVVPTQTSVKLGDDVVGSEKVVLDVTSTVTDACR